MAVLHKEYTGKTDDAYSISDLDLDIRGYIEKNSIGYFDEDIAEDNRLEVFYHLTHMRTSLFQWYEFKADAELLEIGAGFGALTGLFCERCHSVTATESSLFRAESICSRYKKIENLSVYAGGIEDIVLDKKYDYIILSGELGKTGGKQKENHMAYLKRISNLLKPDGKLLIATENRYGLRYFCGEPESYTKKPFRGINRYPDENSGYTFDRQELIEMVEAAGFLHYKFYYPMPDYKLPQIVYSETYLPQKDLCERMILYRENADTLIADERDLYSDIIGNHVFEFFSNSFLIECSYEADFCTVIYAALTTDRGAAHALATTIHERDVVKKRALFQEGIMGIKAVYQNLLELAERGISTVPHEWEGQCLAMPYLHYPTLSDYLRQVATNDPAQLTHLFDELYACILKSSEHVDHTKNALCYEESIEIDFGVILKKAYIDMVPFNCFYIEGVLTFFDQEFSRENYPAKYVLFRALMYTYLLVPSAETAVPLQRLQKKYGMEHLWKIFEAEEARFVADNRRYDIYGNFYSMTRIDKKCIYDNADKLMK